jgi:hypothetical protein
MHKSKLIILLMCFCYATVYSQKQPEYEKKIYTAPDGKIYVQKGLPIYLMMGLKPDDRSGAVVLTNPNMAQYSTPMYFDTEGLNTIRSPWAVDNKTRKLKLPKQEIIFEVYADSHPPTTHISYGTTTIVKHKDKVLVNGSARITLTAYDEFSGVEKIMVSIDGQDYIEYTAPLNLDVEKEYVLRYYSFDHVGNVEPVKTVNVVIDRSKPKSSMEMKGDRSENVYAGNAAIVIKSSDVSSGVVKQMLKIDDKPEQVYTGAIRMSTLSSGEHRIVYYAVDAVGNREDDQVYEFYVDKTPPTIIQDIIGKTFMVNGKEFSSGRAQLKLTVLDNKAGVKAVYYSINDGEYKLYEKPVLLSGINGTIQVKAYAVDKVNNRSQVADDATATVLPYVDLTGPSLKHTLAGPILTSSDTIYINHKTRIQLKAFDNESGVNNIQYKLDGGDLVLYTSPFCVEKEGWHTIEYIGTDNVDNTNASSIKFMVDNTGPVIYTHFSSTPKGVVAEQGKSLEVYPSNTVLFVAATDPESGCDHINVLLNGAKERPINGVVNGLSKINKVILKAYDKLGNETVTSLDFEIKN